MAGGVDDLGREPRVRCGDCGRGVGLLWYRGRSTLVDGPVKTDGQGRLVMAIHLCVARPEKPGDGGGRR